ncbi:hypothetical protein FHW69_000634 [Luteibacter sp. Sphag1AF]|uniref:hypothetical protein n=1 Tax=Luteibacter sp. Sphag1AF TaxID=2587031 RepID=UPI0016145BBA|nr:hypothetical protein [Luteibacter sp. Sphag1AF]MBB3226044.1 hypothetical protein [Luteibacter sp. Sphag1AF]
MRLQKRVLLVAFVLSTALGMSAPAAAHFVTDGASEAKQLSVQCNIFKRSNIAVPRIATGDSPVDMTKPMMCFEQDLKKPVRERDENMVMNYFSLKGSGNITCDSKTTFSGELRLQRSSSPFAPFTMNDKADKISVSVENDKYSATVLTLTGTFTTGTYKGETITAYLPKDCPGTSDEQPLRMLIDPPAPPIDSLPQ